MAIPNDTQWQRKTVAATGTGSFFFNDTATPYMAIQTIPILPATDIQAPIVSWSNVNPKGYDAAITGEANSAVTGSDRGYVWAVDTSFSGTIVPASAFLTSSLYNIGNVGAQHMRIQVPSVAGGEIVVLCNRKG